MTPLFSDTSPDVERLLLARLRDLPPWRKFEMVAEMNRTVRTLALAGIRQRHPDLTPAQHHRLLADQLVGESLAAQAYGAKEFDVAD